MNKRFLIFLVILAPLALVYAADEKTESSSSYDVPESSPAGEPLPAPDIGPLYEEHGQQYEGQYLTPPSEDLQHTDKALPSALGTDVQEEKAPLGSSTGGDIAKENNNLDNLDEKIVNETGD